MKSTPTSSASTASSTRLRITCAACSGLPSAPSVMSPNVSRPSSMVGFIPEAASHRARELPVDRRHQLGIVGGDLRREASDHMAVAADQVLVEIPARQFERLFARRPFVERMLCGAAHLGLGGERKGDAVALMRRVLDLADAARLLS